MALFYPLGPIAEFISLYVKYPRNSPSTQSVVHSHSEALLPYYTISGVALKDGTGFLGM